MLTVVQTWLLSLNDVDGMVDAHCLIAVWRHWDKSGRVSGRLAKKSGYNLHQILRAVHVDVVAGLVDYH